MYDKFIYPFIVVFICLLLVFLFLKDSSFHCVVFIQLYMQLIKVDVHYINIILKTSAVILSLGFS